ncbi:hypothetical protein FACS1894214_3200 [Planctomycetales bacterium]|nr:hypothetical protein FACS1894214_3200 [Planctomycetales bacterium]
MTFKNKRESVLQSMDTVGTEMAASHKYDNADPDRAAFIRLEAGRHQDRIDVLKSVDETFWKQNIRYNSSVIETLIVEIASRSMKEWTQRTGLIVKPVFTLHRRRHFERPIRLAAALPLQMVNIDGLTLTRLDIVNILNERLDREIIQQETLVRIHLETFHGKVVSTCFFGYSKIHRPSIYNVLHTDGCAAYGHLICFALAGFGRIAVITSHDVDKYDLYKNSIYRSIKERMTTRLNEDTAF